MQAHWLDDHGAIDAATLKAQGVHTQRLPLRPDQHQSSLDALKRERGYVAQDVVELSPETENLEAICAKFIDEHLHDDDEVRFVLEGEGVFDIRSLDDRFMRVRVQPGDLIVVPRRRHHRFMLTAARRIRCVRLFRDESGWVPHYRTSDSTHAQTADLDTEARARRERLGQP